MDRGVEEGKESIEGGKGEKVEREFYRGWKESERQRESEREREKEREIGRGRERIDRN